jgi:hypothetical protein
MAEQLQNIFVPNIPSYDFGVGVDRLSGSSKNQVVIPAESPPPGKGAVSAFNVSRISSASELQSSLGIDVSASYGCATFGAGASARFSYLTTTEVHSSTLFLAITASIQLATLSIDHSVLTEEAGTTKKDNPDLFETRYGNMFCRACVRGGLFVAVLRVETFDSTTADKIDARLGGSYGLFSADIKTTLSNIQSEFNTRYRYSLYAEGGPHLDVRDPNDPTEMLDNANKWMKAMRNDPDVNSRPYLWTLSPIAIAEGPTPPNVADIQHAQDILQFCASERLEVLDQIHKLGWYLEKADNFDWTAPQSAPKEFVAQAGRDYQSDLTILSRCASRAIDHPKDALMPAEFAAAQNPPQVYRRTIFPTLPKPFPTLQIPVATLVRMRVKAIHDAQSMPDESYENYRNWANGEYEESSQGIFLDRNQYKFIQSGVRFRYTNLHTGQALAEHFAGGWFLWVVEQEPSNGSVTPDSTIQVGVRGGMHFDFL